MTRSELCSFFNYIRVKDFSGGNWHTTHPPWVATKRTTLSCRRKEAKCVLFFHFNFNFIAASAFVLINAQILDTESVPCLQWYHRATMYYSYSFLHLKIRKKRGNLNETFFIGIIIIWLFGKSFNQFKFWLDSLNISLETKIFFIEGLTVFLWTKL